MKVSIRFRWTGVVCLVLTPLICIMLPSNTLLFRSICCCIMSCRWQKRHHYNGINSIPMKTETWCVYVYAKGTNCSINQFTLVNKTWNTTEKCIGLHAGFRWIMQAESKNETFVLLWFFLALFANNFESFVGLWMEKLIIEVGRGNGGRKWMKMVEVVEIEASTNNFCNAFCSLKSGHRCLDMSRLHVRVSV